MNDTAAHHEALEKRRTFAIISHPDAGKTTLTEKLLLYGGAITLAGSVKGRKASRHATSDWMALEQQRGISVTTSVMQFVYRDRVLNLLDTPGHADFSEDTYRTLTAVDSALMVIDGAKGVEQRTIKLLDVCRLRTTPIMTFVNKMDRDSRDPIALLDEIEEVLAIRCAPITWPIGAGRDFKGFYHLLEDAVYLYQPQKSDRINQAEAISLDSAELLDAIGEDGVASLRDDIELVKGASHTFCQAAYLRGELTPVFFGSAVNNFGVQAVLDAFVEYAPAPQARATDKTEISPESTQFSGFVFKVQANMDPMHHDRVAFLRVCSGRYRKGLKVRHVRRQRDMVLNNAMTFFAADREQAMDAWPGDIIGLHNHGTIQIGDTFTANANQTFKYVGIPNFAAELFRRVVLKDPLKSKALLKGLVQLSEEGATQMFRPLERNDLILGAVGMLQFEVVAHRLLHEYNVRCQYEAINVAAARWVYCDDPAVLERFKQRAAANLALDAADQLTYLAPTQVNLTLTMERWPEIQFTATREH